MLEYSILEAVETTCPLIPTQNYVALVVQEQPPSGIIVVPSKKSPFGEIAAIGPDCILVGVGERVIYRRWTTEVTSGGKTYLLVNEDDLLARV